MNCSFMYNHDVCVPNCGLTFTVCATACPAGYRVTSSTCAIQCASGSGNPCQTQVTCTKN